MISNPKLLVLHQNLSLKNLLYQKKIQLSHLLKVSLERHQRKRINNNNSKRRVMRHKVKAKLNEYLHFMRLVFSDVFFKLKQATDTSRKRLTLSKAILII